MIVYDGPSQLDGEPIVAIATEQTNPKTGKMLFVWIMRSDVSPEVAAYNGDDASICGGCRWRAGTGKPRDCYVRLSSRKVVDDHPLADEEWGPLEVYKEYKLGGFDNAHEDTENWSFADTPLPTMYMGDLPVRLGAYGDPAAVPTSIWSVLLKVASSWTGYTHNFRTCDPDLKQYCMASTDTLEEYEEAKGAGWRPFLVVPDGVVGPDDAILCPATSGAGATCATCELCQGSASPCSKPIWEKAHGNNKTEHVWPSIL